MLENETIQAIQFKKMVSIFIVGTSIILIPTMLASEAKQDAWISAIVSMIVGLLLVFIYNALGHLYPGRSLVELSRDILGSWFGTCLSLLIVFYCFILTSLVLRNLGDFLTAALIPETPIQAIHIVYLCIIVIGVRYGPCNIARTADLFYPWILILFVIFVILLVPNFEFKHLQPVLAKGIEPVLNASYPFIAFPFMELFLFLMIFPLVKEPKAAGRAFLKGTFYGGLILFVITLLCLLVLGAENTASNLYSSFELAKKIKITEIIQRVEVIIAAIWFLTIFVKLILCFYILISSLSQTLKLSDYRSLALPMGMILYSASIVISPNISYLITFDIKIWPLFALTFGLFFPLLLLGIALIKRERYSS